jgi:hypothetical protein
MAKNPGTDISEAEDCMFCGSRYFYFESPLDLFFLGRASICYVCEARYTGVEIDHPEGQYNEESARSAQRSGSSLRWDERVKRHGPQAGI